MNLKKVGGIITALLLIIICNSVALAENGTSSDDMSLNQIQFIKNIGQADKNILYQVKSADISFDFTKDGLIANRVNKTCGECNESRFSPVLITIKGADTTTQVESINRLPGYANFLKGQNESEWYKEVPWFGGVRYHNILPGINLTYKGNDGLLKREFEIVKGADPSAIRMVYEGAGNLSIDNEGSLIITTSFGQMTERPPYSYQDIAGTRVTVNSSYQIYDNGDVGYSLAGYNHEYPLIIDPYLEYSTFLGGSLEDFGMDIDVDKEGNAYITGYTSSCNFPVLNPLNITSPVRFNGTYCHNSRDVFVTKIGKDQTTGNATILFSTFIGGQYDDSGRGIAVDSLYNMYIAGDTYSDDFPIVSPFPYGVRLHGSDDAFIIKLNSNGDDILWSDYLGGNFADQANSLDIDDLNAVYLTGKTVGNSPYKKLEEIFPVTSNAYQTSPNPDATMGDAFVTKISPDGKKIEYSSYISGSAQDSGNGITVDGRRMAYIAGTTSSTNLLPSDVPGYQKVLKGGQDAFLFKMDLQAGLPPVYASYLGGSTGYDYGEAVKVDSEGCAYVTGATASYDVNGPASDNFPITEHAMQPKKGWPYDAFEKDAFITKFNKDGQNLTYSTFLGGSADDWGYDIDVDKTGRAIVTGFSSSSQIPSSGLVNPVKEASGVKDGFLTIVNKDGTAADFSTLFGGFRDDISRAVAIGPENDASTIYVTGYTSSPGIVNLISGDCCEIQTFPVNKWINQAVYGGIQYNGGKNAGDYSGNFDAFVIKFGTLIPVVLFGKDIQQYSLDKVSGTPPSFDKVSGTPPLNVTFLGGTYDGTLIDQAVWNFGDGNETTMTRPSGWGADNDWCNTSHKYYEARNYSPSLTITNLTYGDGYVLYPDQIGIYNPLKLSFIINPEPPGVVGQEFTFTDTSPDNLVKWEWDFDDTTPKIPGNPVKHSFTAKSSYDVTLTGGISMEQVIMYPA